MKKAASRLLFLLALTAFLPVAAVEYCPQCEKKISRVRFYKEDKMVFCSRKCAEQWRKDDRPKCPVCLKPVKSPGVKTGEMAFCSERCRKRAGGVCFVCHDKKSNLIRFSDGLQVCRECSKQGVFDPAAAAKDFDGVREVLKTKFDLYAPGTIRFTLCDRETIRKLQKRKSENTDGLCLLYSDGKREIYLRRGMPSRRFRAVAAHELAHDWFNIFVRRHPAAEVMEGWAEFVSWHYCDLFRFRNEQKMIEENGIKVYSQGFRMMKNKLKIRMGREELIRRLSEFPEEKAER